MSAPSVPTPIKHDLIIACLACGDPFTPHGLADGVVPILFSCGHTVCVDCAKAVALSIPGYDGKWACGWCKRGGGGAVNAGVIALLQYVYEGVDLGPASSHFQVDDEPNAVSMAPINFSTLSDGAAAAITSAVADLERVNTARATLRAGYESSRTAFIAGVDTLLSAIMAHRDRVLGDAKQVFDAREKALGIQVEELSVKVSLLRQAVDVCRDAMTGDVGTPPAVYESVEKVMKGLTREPFGGLTVCPVVGLGVEIEAVMKTVEANMFVKRGVSAPDCELSGSGMDCFVLGEDGHGWNVLNLVCVDDQRCVVKGVDPLDVTITMTPVDLVRIMPSIPSRAASALSWAYSVQDDSDVGEVVLDVRVYGKRIGRCPVKVPPVLGFIGSTVTVLSSVDPVTLVLFFKRIRSWLPDARSTVLLYRMSRDGTATSDFHSRCDDKGPTVVLIRSDNGFVFGGYAGKAWHSRNESIPGLDSIIFTVCNLHGIPPTRYQVMNPNRALYGHADYGPVFGGGIQLGRSGSVASTCSIPFTNYDDTTGKGAATFTGAIGLEACTPAEVEVWLV